MRSYICLVQIYFYSSISLGESSQDLVQNSTPMSFSFVSDWSFTPSVVFIAWIIFSHVNNFAFIQIKFHPPLD